MFSMFRKVGTWCLKQIKRARQVLVIAEAMVRAGLKAMSQFEEDTAAAH